MRVLGLFWHLPRQEFPIKSEALQQAFSEIFGILTDSHKGLNHFSLAPKLFVNNGSIKKKLPVGIQVGKIDIPEQVEKESHSAEQHSLNIPSCGQSKQVSTHKWGQIT